ncbi:Thioredoxin [Orchesella cincta]|uniref:Thioredoxin n=1 Tax=Orchesella cincta TaxID=48709 RepID=A0A1D2MM18_ORCCI|nr:Thioredoxin [Orchesella cincta]
MPVIHVSSDSEYKSVVAQNNNGERLFLVDFSAKWCGPCKNIAPVFVSLSDKHGHDNFKFIHVDVDECDEVAREAGVKALPTFVFYNNTTELVRIQGADQAKLEAKIVELGPKYKKFFSGEGNKLGGSAGSSTTSVQGSSALSSDEIVSIAQASVEHGDKPCRVGIKFMPAIQNVPKATLKINGSDKVRKIRDFVDSILEMCDVSSPYELHNSYPPGKLDEDKRVSDAGVAGAVVLVKLS